uniref:TPR_REGION domain-containing protein n=1 Tax=Macrostomum lignano TaxID=282301 RepID=A0A1I8G192_9PLAT
SVQCIRSSFDLSSIDVDAVPSLPDTFSAGCKSLNKPEVAVKREITPEDKAEAERLKGEGNKFISENKPLEAVNAYTMALAKDPYNAVYYGNRAAAYSKLNDHAAAIRDCERALQNDPAYSKAYGRMGFAYAAQKNHAKAAGAAAGFPGFPGAGGRGGAGGLDLMSLLNNPQMMQMASQMMQSPQVQQMVASMMGGGPGGPFSGAAAGEPSNDVQSGGPGGEDPPASLTNNQQQETPPGQPNMQDLLRMGQQFASQMQAANPDLVESLRQEFQQGGGVSGDPGGPEQPPSSDQGEDRSGN